MALTVSMRGSDSAGRGHSAANHETAAAWRNAISICSKIESPHIGYKANEIVALGHSFLRSLARSHRSLTRSRAHGKEVHVYAVSAH